MNRQISSTLLGLFPSTVHNKANAAEADSVAVIQPWRPLCAGDFWRQIAAPDAKTAHWEDLVGARSSFGTGTRQVDHVGGWSGWSW